MGDWRFVRCRPYHRFALAGFSPHIGKQGVARRARIHRTDLSPGSFFDSRPCGLHPPYLGLVDYCSRSARCNLLNRADRNGCDVFSPPGALHSLEPRLESIEGPEDSAGPGSDFGHDIPLHPALAPNRSRNVSDSKKPDGRPARRARAATYRNRKRWSIDVEDASAQRRCIHGDAFAGFLRRSLSGG